MTETQTQYSGAAPGSRVTPNSTEVMVLGILSIVLCWCWGIVSVILGIVTLALASQGEKHYRLNPSLYSEVSYRNLRTGKICAIVGLSLAVLTVVAMILYFLVFGTFIFKAVQNSWQY